MESDIGFFLALHMARRLQYLCSAMLRQCSLQGPLEYHQSEIIGRVSYVFFATLAPFWNPVGSIFEVPGTLGQHLGSILAPLVAKADSGASFGRLFFDFGHPLNSKWAARATEGDPKVPKRHQFGRHFK